VDLGPDDILTSQRKGGTGPAPVDRCADAVRDLLASGPMPSAELDRRLEEAGYSNRTARRARQRAEVKVTREGFGADGKFMVSLPAPEEADDGDAPEPPEDLAP
jgi:hypothetical protein